jgi:hypothetical protein
MNPNACQRCSSEDLIPQVKIVDHGYMDSKHDLGIELHGNPKALIFKDTYKGTLRATVCGNCGYVELAIENPREMWEIYCRIMDR